MARYNERTTRQSRFEEDEEPRSTRRQHSSSRNKKQQQRDVEYFPIFSLFGNLHEGKGRNSDRLSIDIKAYDGKGGSIEDHLTIDEFLFFCEKLYYGEPISDDDEYGVKLVGSLWELDNPTKESTHSGNIRFSEDKLEQIKAEYQRSLKGTKTSAKKTHKPKYEVPEEAEEDEEFEEVIPQKKRRTPVKPAVELDMQVEEVNTEEIPY